MPLPAKCIASVYLFMKQTTLALKALFRLVLFVPFYAFSQPVLPPDKPLTQQECVVFALQSQPLVRQALIDQEIAKASNQIALAGWLPQVGVTGTAQHYFGLPFTIFPNPATGLNEPRQLGVRNTSTLGLAGTQTIYSNDVLLARRASRYNLQGA